jgi:hypothetical protein
MAFTVSGTMPALQDRFFSFDTCYECRSIAVTVVPDTPLGPGAPVVDLSVQVFNAQSEVVAVFEPLAQTAVVESTRFVGVTPGSRYYVRVHEESGPAVDLNITLAGRTDAYEIEPNDSMAQATPLVSGFTFGGDWAGIDTGKVDADYYQFVNNGISGKLVLSASRLPPVTLDSAVTLAVVDSLGRPLAAERSVLDSPFEASVGLDALGSYFVRISSGPSQPRQAYILNADVRSVAFEMEPNDTVPNAGLLLENQEVSGGYSASQGSDDDVFKIAVPDGKKRATISVALSAPEGGIGTLELAILDAAETLLAQQTVAPGEPRSVSVSIGSDPSIYVRLRSSATFIEHEYTLSVGF